MTEYLKKVKELMQSFKEAEVLHISRGLNNKADSLSKLASVAFDHLAKDVKVETLGQPSITEVAITNIEVPEENWMTPILLRSYLGPSLKCVDLTKVEYIIREIHEGICGMHMGEKMVAARAMRDGYYWPAMFLSALKEIQSCDSFQIYAPITR
ncbi:uncharacterized protein LOC143629633 [Bidens hawaiensis]|uniref:uncharacterized protein LOC143629633 n=1 Tax=Bidens hawaiensis TaxID=980011 RepID=UPI00404B8C8D